MIVAEDKDVAGVSLREKKDEGIDKIKDEGWRGKESSLVEDIPLVRERRVFG